MITMAKYSRLRLAAAIATLLLISCEKESVQSIHRDDSMVTFTIQTPAQPTTRALDANATRRCAADRRGSLQHGHRSIRVCRAVQRNGDYRQRNDQNLYGYHARRNL